MATIGDIGDRVDLLIRRGTTFGPHQVTMQNPDGTPVDLTGATVRGYLYDHHEATAPAATLTVAMTAPTTGQFEFWLPATHTASLRAGKSPTDRSGAYIWDMEIEYADGTLRPLYYGTAQVVA